MWSWKTAKLLADIFYNSEIHKNILVLWFEQDIRFWKWIIKSRNWKSVKANHLYNNTTNFNILLWKDIIWYDIFIDESQFLTKEQVIDIYLNYWKNNNIYFYWLLTNFKNELFEWSSEIIKYTNENILIWHDHLKCHVCWDNPNINWRFINWQLMKEWQEMWIEHWNIEYNVICVRCFSS